MNLNLIEQINKKLQEAQKQTTKVYEDLGLNKDFNKWFEDLDRDKKLEIYKMFQLEIMEFDS